MCVGMSVYAFVARHLYLGGMTHAFKTCIVLKSVETMSRPRIQLDLSKEKLLACSSDNKVPLDYLWK